MWVRYQESKATIGNLCFFGYGTKYFKMLPNEPRPSKQERSSEKSARHDGYLRWHLLVWCSRSSFFGLSCVGFWWRSHLRDESSCNPPNRKNKTKQLFQSYATDFENDYIFYSFFCCFQYSFIKLLRHCLREDISVSGVKKHLFWIGYSIMTLIDLIISFVEIDIFFRYFSSHG